MSFNVTDFLSQTDLNDVKARQIGGLPKGRYQFSIGGYEMEATKNNDGKPYISGKLQLVVDAVISVDDPKFEQANVASLLGRKHTESDYIEVTTNTESGEINGISKDGLGTMKATALMLLGVKEGSAEAKAVFAQGFNFNEVMKQLVAQKVQGAIGIRINKQTGGEISNLMRTGKGILGVMNAELFSTQFAATSQV